MSSPLLRILPSPLRPVALALTLLLAAGGAQAQSLSALYDAARAYDATYLAARSLADSAQYRAAQADALRLPSAALTGSASKAETNAPGGNSTSLDNQTLSLDGSFPLYNKTNAATISQAERALELSKADLEAAEQDLIVRVAQAYFDVLAATDTLAAALTGKRFINEQLASAKRNFEVGTATITDTREAQARFDLATARELVADNDLRTKRTVLDQLVGRSAVAPKGLALPVKLPPVVPATHGWQPLHTDALRVVGETDQATTFARTSGSGFGAVRFVPEAPLTLAENLVLALPLEVPADVALNLHVQTSVGSFLVPVTGPSTGMKALLTPDFEKGECFRLPTLGESTVRQRYLISESTLGNGLLRCELARGIARLRGTVAGVQILSLTLGNSSNQDYLLAGSTANRAGSRFTVGEPRFVVEGSLP